jgi:hypothetical protein
MPSIRCAQHVERLNNVTPAAGERHEEATMAVFDRHPTRPANSDI